jgi:hypothetical protein
VAGQLAQEAADVVADVVVGLVVEPLAQLVEDPPLLDARQVVLRRVAGDAVQVLERGGRRLRQRAAQASAWTGPGPVRAVGGAGRCKQPVVAIAIRSPHQLPVALARLRAAGAGEVRQGYPPWDLLRADPTGWDELR